MSNLATVAATSIKSVTEDPRAVRYGIVFGLPLQVRAQAFGSQQIEAGVVWPFRAFAGEVVRGTFDGSIIATHERLPAEQVADLQSKAGFVELPLMGLPENAVGMIADALLNINACEKYPLDTALDAAQVMWSPRKCLTCVKKHLMGDAPRLIQALPVELKDAAMNAASIMLSKVNAVIVEFQTQVNAALQALDTKEQKILYAYNLLMIRHLHADEPEFKTSINQNTAIMELAAVLKGGQGSQDIEAIVAAAIAKQRDDIRKEVMAELGAGEPKQETLSTEPSDERTFSIGDKVVTPNGLTAEIVQKPFGKLRVQYEDGSTAMLEKGEVS